MTATPTTPSLRHTSFTPSPTPPPAIALPSPPASPVTNTPSCAHRRKPSSPGLPSSPRPVPIQRHNTAPTTCSSNDAQPFLRPTPRPRRVRSQSPHNDDDEDDYRWSEVIPPQSGITFAAVWDPDEGMFTFSGPQLRDFPSTNSTAFLSNSNMPLAPSTPAAYSQVLSIDGLGYALGSPSQLDDADLRRAGDACTLTTADADTYLDSYYPASTTYKSVPTSAAIPDSINIRSVPSELNFAVGPSSIRRKLHLDTLYGSEPASPPPLPLPTPETPRDRVDRCVGTSVCSRRPARFDGDEHLSVSDEGFFEHHAQQSHGGHSRSSSAPAPGCPGRAGQPQGLTLEIPVMPSSFSTTTTSTSSYVEIPRESYSLASDDTSSFVTVRAPDLSEYPPDARPTAASPLSHPSSAGSQRRRLQKRRSPSTSPVSPQEVLARERFNYVHCRPCPSPSSSPSPSPSPSTPKDKGLDLALKKLVSGIPRCKRTDDERWVSVEIKQMVTQKVL